VLTFNSTDCFVALQLTINSGTLQMTATVNYRQRVKKNFMKPLVGIDFPVFDYLTAGEHWNGTSIPEIKTGVKEKHIKWQD
jgi:hypothetical protein